MIFFFLFSFTMFYFYLIFPLKLLCLLLMEVMFICCFFVYSFFHIFIQEGFFFSSFVLVVFLVLDSVLGISLLLSIGRSEGVHLGWIF